MGLDTSHNCWHGSYGTFNQFRHILALQIGINLEEYIGYGNNDATKHLNDIPHEIMPLLNHSDCEGSLSIKESRLVAKGLTKILDNWIPGEYDMFFKKKVEQFRDGCLDAVKKRQIIQFH